MIFINYIVKEPIRFSTLTYAGAFVLRGRAIDRALAPAGYIKGDTAYYFLRDHQGSVRQVVCGADGSVVQENQYYPYGSLHGESSALALASANGASASPYKYGGKEHISFANAHLLDFAADPVNHVDPTGCRPVYSTTGEFLGVTDDTGLKGDYIIVDETLFNPDTDRVLKSEREKEISVNKDGISKEALNSIEKHQSTLSSRPDYDGELTLREANEWYNEGNGESLFLRFE